MPREMRKTAQWAAVYAGVCLLWQPCIRAQQMPAMPAPVLQTNPQLALREFEPAENQEYELGRGDAISIDFGGRPEMSSKQIVGPDGMITLPMAGSIAVADKTRPQAAQAIIAALTPYYQHLNVTVGVDKYTSNQVLLLGAVEHPGVLTFDRPPTLLEAVSRGGGCWRCAQLRLRCKWICDAGEPAVAYGQRCAGACGDLSRRRQGDLGRIEKTSGQRKRPG